MRNFRLALIAMLAVLVVAPFAMPANAQFSVGIGVGPDYYGPPDCAWGYYNYSPYACAPYGYYGSSWFAGGVFIGAGPWYGLGRRAYAYPGYGSRGGYGGYNYGANRGGYVAPRNYGGDRDRDRAYAGGNRGNYGGGYVGGGNRSGGYVGAPNRGNGGGYVGGGGNSGRSAPSGGLGAGARGGFSGGSRGFSGGSRGFSGGGGNGGARGGGRR